MEETHVHHAYRRVVNERNHISDRMDGFERFRKGVLDTQPVSRGLSPRSTGGFVAALTGSPTDRCETVLELFDETVREHSTQDIDGTEPLIETVAEELGEEVAYTLSPRTDAKFNEGAKKAVLSSVADRQSEIRAMQKALSVEEESIERSLETVEEVVCSDCLEKAEGREVALLNLGFDELQQMYREISELEERCEERMRKRQEVLHETTNHDAEAGLRHRQLVGYLYEDFPTDYPVLFTLTKLNELCGEAKRTVSGHLSRTAV